MVILSVNNDEISKNIDKITERLRILRIIEDLLSRFDKLLLSKGASLMLVLPP